MSPLRVSTAGDVYAFGVTMWEVMELGTCRTIYPHILPSAIPTHVAANRARPEWRGLKQVLAQLPFGQAVASRMAAVRAAACGLAGSAPRPVQELSAAQLLAHKRTSDEQPRASLAGPSSGSGAAAVCSGTESPAARSDPAQQEAAAMAAAAAAYVGLAERCWAQEPGARPSATEVVGALEALAARLGHDGVARSDE